MNDYVTVGSLFSGYGGLDIALRNVLSAETIWVCDSDSAASAVLAHHWPGVPNLGDMLRLLGNGVVPRQAGAALRYLLPLPDAGRVAA